jgi:hypothetical protein
MLLDRFNSLIAGSDGSSSPNGLARRTVLQAGLTAGGGLLLSLSLPALIGDVEAANADSFSPNAFIRIEGDGKIVLTMPYVEMGQGTYTSIPMLIAEELEVDLKQVQLEHAPPNEKLYSNPLLGVQATGNSNAIRGAWEPLRQAGATARTCSYRRRQSAGTSIRRPAGRNLVKCFTRRQGEALNMASLPATRPGCLSQKGWRSSDRRISSSSEPRPRGWMHLPRSTERPSMASMFGRVA